MVNLNKSLTKEQKKLLFDIIRNTVMKFKFIIGKDQPVYINKGFIIGNFWSGSDGNYFFNCYQDFNVDYYDDCVSISIKHISIIPGWLGKDKDIENSTQLGTYRTQIYLEEKNQKHLL